MERKQRLLFKLIPNAFQGFKRSGTIWMMPMRGTAGKENEISFAAHKSFREKAEG
jgi:hypothetical protein